MNIVNFTLIYSFIFFLLTIANKMKDRERKRESDNELPKTSGQDIIRTQNFILGIISFFLVFHLARLSLISAK